MSTDSPKNATSTQLPLSDAVLFRHTIPACSESATLPPSSKGRNVPQPAPRPLLGVQTTPNLPKRMFRRPSVGVNESTTRVLEEDLVLLPVALTRFHEADQAMSSASLARKVSDP